MAHPALPKWLEAELPLAREQVTLGKTPEGTYTLSEEAAFPLEFPTLEAAYDAFGSREEHTLVLARELQEELVGDGLFTVVESGRGLFFVTDECSRHLLEETYSYFLSAKGEWEADTEDFLASYYFIELHPAFWLRQDSSRSFLWHTSAGAPTTVFPHRGEEGEVQVTLEAGGHVFPELVEHYHDPRLDTTAATYEEAVVALAKKVALLFDEEGNEREGVELEPSPEWQRVAALIEEARAAGELK